MIREAKDLLATVIASRVPEATIVRSVKEESQAVMARKWPLVALITNPGTFDNTEARKARYFDVSDGVWKERYIRGVRELPILVRCWGEGEEETDVLFGRILPAIPSRWQYDNFLGTIDIVAEEHSDHTGNTAKLYLSVAEVRFKVPVALEEGIVPTIDEIDIGSGEYA